MKNKSHPFPSVAPVLQSFSDGGSVVKNSPFRFSSRFSDPRHTDTPTRRLPSTINPNNHQPAKRFLVWLPVFALCLSGCQVLTYESPTGERFTRSSFGSKTAIASLSVEATTNGVRRVELRGYQQDSSQALGVMTDAAVRAAISAAKP